MLVALAWPATAGLGPDFQPRFVKASDGQPAEARDLVVDAAQRCPARLLDERGRGALPLFSALTTQDTMLAERWAAEQADLAELFPHLRIEPPENLHITLVFMSPRGWDAGAIDTMERYALDGPKVSGRLELSGSMETFGPKNDVAVLHFESIPSEWTRRLVANRQVLTDIGLRPRDRYDDAFNAHISLAYAPTEQDKPELERFERWMTEHADLFGGLKISIPDSARPRLFVVVGRGDDTRFVPLRDCLASSRSTSVAQASR